MKFDRLKFFDGAFCYEGTNIDEWAIESWSDDEDFFALYSYGAYGHGELASVASEVFPRGVVLIACEKPA